MKTYLSSLMLLFVFGPVFAQAPNGRGDTLMGATVVEVVPSEAGEERETRSHTRLRDSLRLSLGEQDDTVGKPYRLTLEERHLLREQLRSQTNNLHKK
ncbi:MAG: hypothetical protein A2W72_09500 [Burkholderiales bacterium RIFCSPLOWO2_12_67_14]|nr:MAG: hypothetical protein A3I64_05355 [Burkholderiales bacterium RIFCSPLOWO2_02_FULL_67_64]OGB39928.1 MAG: hypothetical protein A2W72_09500 [Burkholderiales bacterium RIFCSPLOWO2_12_67_14]OGB52582.1 MAG: hypothetical protein A3E51_13815 [Burkholderiales bacterium RIFCSPHIGHO2_12_FULL_67_38]OGB76183.1 MAG: hypothetical protein A3G82_20835 [Burkholderiales bacterium RIFCSPLOWO2_12_FULL_67_210]